MTEAVNRYLLSRRGEQVQQQVGLRPQPVGQVALLLGIVAPVEREPAHDVVVPGFDGGLVVLPVRAAPGLFDVLVLEPVDELVVDGLRAVVGVEAGDWEREQGDRQVDGPADVGLGVVAHGDAHGPVGRVVHHRQRPGELAPGSGPAVRDRVGLRQARQARDLVGALADADRVAQMLAGRTRQRHAPGHGRPFERPQPPVDGRRTHRAHLLERVPVHVVEFPVGPERGDPLVEHRLHVRTARHAHQQPQPLQ